MTRSRLPNALIYLTALFRPKLLRPHLRVPSESATLPTGFKSLTTPSHRTCRLPRAPEKGLQRGSHRQGQLPRPCPLSHTFQVCTNSTICRHSPTKTSSTLLSRSTSSPHSPSYRLTTTTDSMDRPSIHLRHRPRTHRLQLRRLPQRPRRHRRTSPIPALSPKLKRTVPLSRLNTSRSPCAPPYCSTPRQNRRAPHSSSRTSAASSRPRARSGTRSSGAERRSRR